MEKGKSKYSRSPIYFDDENCRSSFFENLKSSDLNSRNRLISTFLGKEFYCICLNVKDFSKENIFLEKIGNQIILKGFKQTENYHKHTDIESLNYSFNCIIRHVLIPKYYAENSKITAKIRKEVLKLVFYKVKDKINIENEIITIN